MPMQWKYIKILLLWLNLFIKGYFGEYCEFKRCKKECLNGKCDYITGNCVCDKGYGEIECSKKICENYCNYNVNNFFLLLIKSKKGICKDGECVCYEGFKGKQCEISYCVNNCSNKGFCHRGKCHCLYGFYGEDCSKVLEK